MNQCFILRFADPDVLHKRPRTDLFTRLWIKCRQ